MSAYTEIPKIKAENGELPPKVLNHLDGRYGGAVQWQDTTEYWVAPDGSDTTGDGTPTKPYATLSQAIDQAMNLPVQHTSANRDSSITIYMGPGIYRGPRPALPDNTAHNIKLRIIGEDVGGHPNEPTTQFHDIDQIVFWTHNPNLELYLENIKFVNCRTGVSLVNGKIHTVNVHAENCHTGVRNSSGYLTVDGGIFTDCQNGVYSFMVNRHTIGTQHAGNTDAGPWFYNNSTAVRLQETVTGHVDYCHFEGNNIGIRVNRGANVNPEGSEFYNNATGVKVERNATALFPAERPMVFGTGTRANGKNIDAVSGSVITGSPHWASISNNDALSESFIKSVTTIQDIDGPDTTTNIVSEQLSPLFWKTDGTSQHADKSIVFKVYGAFYGEGTGTRRLRYHYGSSQEGGGFFDHVWTDYSNPIVGSFEAVFEIVAITDQQQVVKITSTVDGQIPKVSVDRLNVDMTQEQLVRIIATVNHENMGIRIQNTQAWIRGL